MNHRHGSQHSQQHSQARLDSRDACALGRMHVGRFEPTNHSEAMGRSKKKDAEAVGDSPGHRAGPQPLV